MKLKKYGEGSMGVKHGYDLPLLIGWLEDLVNHEEACLKSSRGAKARRHEAIENAVSQLSMILDKFPEE